VPEFVGLALASTTLTDAVEVEEPSAKIEAGVKLQARPVAGPGVNTTLVVVVETPAREPPGVNVTVQPVVVVSDVKVNVARPAVDGVVPVVAGFGVAPTPVQLVPPAKLAVIAWPPKLGFVIRLPLASWTVITVNGQVVMSVVWQPAVAGDWLVDAASLFGAPTMIVVSVAELPAIEVLFVVASHEQVPGVVVDVTVKFAVPAATVVGPSEPGVQTDAPLDRLIVIAVEPSVVMALPFASVTMTRRRAIEVPSAAIVPGLKVAVVLVAEPMALTVTVWLQPVREPDATETWAVPLLPATVV
jgi:hypothetical protein